MTSDRLFALLREEMEHGVAAFNGRLEALESAAGGLTADPELLDATTAIRGALRVTGLSAIEPLVAAIEATIARPMGSTESARALLAEAIDVLVRVGSAPTAAAALDLVADAQRVTARLCDATGTPSEAPVEGSPAVKATTLELFALECETHAASLSDGLLALERDPHRTDLFDGLMRAAHSIKGAARVVALEGVVALAHALEDHLIQARRTGSELPEEQIEILLQATDALAEIGSRRGVGDPAALALLTESLRQLTPVAGSPEPAQYGAVPSRAKAAQVPAEPVDGAAEDGRVLRIRASQISRMVGFASEALVEASRLKALWETQNRLRERQSGLSDLVNDLHQALGAPSVDTRVGVQIGELRTRIEECRSMFSLWQDEFEDHARRGEELTLRMHREATASRMRPLADALQAFPRMVHDLSRKLGKKVDIVFDGEELSLDREILEKIEAPLTHVVRNAIDHGIETPEKRRAAGKPPTGVITLEARHRAGSVAIAISDDGCGLGAARIRERVIALGLLPPEEASRIGDTEILDYVFAPGLSTADSVTEISGRGVGMDIVQSVMHEVGGSVHVTSEVGKGTSIQLVVPVSRSVVRGVIVTIAGEPYAFPLARIDRVLVTSVAEVAVVGGCQTVAVDGRNVMLVPTAQILELAGGPTGDELTIVVASDRAVRFGFVVEELVGEFDLLVRPLDPRIGRVADLSAAAILPDGRPVLIVDVDDLARSVSRLQQVTRIERIAASTGPGPRAPRILVVDDSISVRELEKRLLVDRGYEVDVAGDGHAGWSMVRERRYDLVVLDIDMPRVDGLSLTRSIKQDARLRDVSVLLVSYRSTSEDRARGLEAGADAYLTKAEFRDETFLEIVTSIVGRAPEPRSRSRRVTAEGARE